MPDGPIVDLRGIALRRPGALILRDVSLQVGPGQAVGLFGANGSGKSTLLRLLATLERPSGGSGTILGAALGSGDVEAIRRRIALVGHQAALRDNLTLGENLALFARLASQDGDAAVAALRAVGLGAAVDRRAAICSNGMRRRADFARVALIEPDLLLLDEAHVGLDTDAAVLVEQIVMQTRERGGAAVVVSHERERVAGLVDRTVTLVDGRLEGS